MRFSALFLVACLPGIAAADVTGIWTDPTTNDGFASIHTEGSDLVMIILDSEELTWEALYGPFDGTTADIELVFGPPGQAKVKLVFDSDSEARLILEECLAGPGVQCNFQPGTELQMSKIY